MRRSFVGSAAVGLVAVVFFAGMGTAQAQEAAVPRLMQFGGVLKDSLGRPLGGVQGVAFALYREQEGGAPLWLETQNVTADEHGRFAVLLGATRSEGVPLELFVSGESRWLGVQAQVQGEVEQPRVLLVSVPYALKAADAETLGGKPLSAFLLADPGVANASRERTASSAGAGGKDPFLLNTAAVTGGTPGTLGMFDADGVSLVNSPLVNSGGSLGLGTATPLAKFHIAGDATKNVEVMRVGSTSSSWGATDDTARMMWLGAGFAHGYLTYRPAGKEFYFTGQGSVFDDAAVTLRARGSLKIDGAGLSYVMGNFGIGTEVPGVKLHISNGATKNAETLRIGATETSWGATDDTARMMWLGAGVAHGVMTYRPAAREFYFTGFGSAFDDSLASLHAKGVLRIDGTGNSHITGNLGVGTTTPGEKLDVVGNAKASGNLTVDTDTLFVDATNNRVGVGTTSPNARLHVAGGAINAAGGLLVLGNAAITGTPGVNGVIFPDGTTQTTAFLGGGGGTVTSLSQGTGIDLTPDTITTTGTIALSAAALTRNITYLGGCDACSVLVNGDDQRTIYANLVGAMTINSVTCFSDAGTPSINLQRDDGIPANILNSDLTCESDNDGATSANIAGLEAVLNLNEKLDFVMVSAGGTAKRVTVTVKATLQ